MVPEDRPLVKLCVLNIFILSVICAFINVGKCMCNMSVLCGICVSEKSSVFVKDPTDLMTNVYGDTLVTTNGNIYH